MNRRTAVKNLVIASGSVITLPFWMGCGTADAPATHLSSFSPGEQKLLATITDTILPAVNGIGALSMGVDKFLQKLFDDCHPKEVQDNVKTQLAGLETAAQLVHKKAFAGCTPAQRQELLTKLSTSENKPEKDFFNLIRSETVRGFVTSKEVMQKYLDYKVAPGHYYGCVAIKA